MTTFESHIRRAEFLQDLAESVFDLVADEGRQPTQEEARGIAIALDLAKGRLALAEALGRLDNGEGVGERTEQDDLFIRQQAAGLLSRRTRHVPTNVVVEFPSDET